MCVWYKRLYVWVYVLILALTTSQLQEEDEPSPSWDDPWAWSQFSYRKPPHLRSTCVPQTHSLRRCEWEPAKCGANFVYCAVRYCTGRKRSHSPAFHSNQSTCCSKSWVISWRGVHITFGQKQFECAFQTRRFAKLANNKKEKPHAIRTIRLFLQQFPIKLQKIKQEKQKCVRKWSEKILRKKPRKLKWKHQLNIEDIKTTISTISAANGYLGYLLKVRLK